MGHLTTVRAPPWLPHAFPLTLLWTPVVLRRGFFVRPTLGGDAAGRGRAEGWVLGWERGCATKGNAPRLIACELFVQIKKMKLVHACGPYGNDCGGPSSFSGKTVSLKSTLPTLRESPLPLRTAPVGSSPEGQEARAAFSHRLWRMHTICRL